jgi:hypothetical protein
MLKRSLTLAAVTALLAACSGGGPRGLTSPNAHDLAPSFQVHTEPGIPGRPNCRGQTTAFLAQAAKHGDIPSEFRGIGGLARGALPVSPVIEQAVSTVQEIHAAVEAFCAGSNPDPT